MQTDVTVIVIYLFVSAAAGLLSSSEMSGVRDFSLSTRRYGVFVLTATLSASFIGGGFSSGNAARTAQFGVGNIAALFGFSLGVIAVGAIIVPRIKRFSGASSAGEIMRDAYGRGAQILTGVFGTAVCAGILGAQISAMGKIFAVFLGLPELTGILVGFAAVLVYSTLGGMRAVVVTDVIQFVVLFVGMPLLLFFSLRAAGGFERVIELTPQRFFRLDNGTTPLGFVSALLTFALGEALVPPYVQRLLMGSDIKTTRRATVLSGLLSMPFFVITGMVGIAGAALLQGSGSDMNNVMQTMIKLTVPPGLRGLIISSMLAIVMSSADAFLNSASVSLVCDVIAPLRRENPDGKGYVALVRAVNVGVGALAAVFALAVPDLLAILTSAYTFWAPVILVPLACALMGVRYSKSVFYLGCVSGALTAAAWKLLREPLGINAAVVGFAACAAVFALSERQGTGGEQCLRRKV